MNKIIKHYRMAACRSWACAPLHTTVRDKLALVRTRTPKIIQL